MSHKSKSTSAFNTPVFISCVFMIIGVVFLLVGVIIGIAGSKFEENADKVTAIISTIDADWDGDGDIHHKVFVEYSYQGEFYQHVHLDYYSSGMFEGDEIEILVSRDNPRKISSSEGTRVMIIVFSALGLAFIIGAMIPLILMVRKNIKRKDLMQNGHRIYAVVEDIWLNHNVAVNGRNPYVVYCNYEDIYTGVVYKFKSNNIWTDPRPILQPGSTVTVYVSGHNPEDYSKYHVDVESALEGKIVDYT